MRRAALLLLLAALPPPAAPQPPLPAGPTACTQDLIRGIAWGAGTGAYQFEGAAAPAAGRRAASVWDAFIAANPGAIADGSNADVADDLAGRFRSDIELMQKLKVRPAIQIMSRFACPCSSAVIRKANCVCRFAAARLIPGCCAKSNVCGELQQHA